MDIGKEIKAAREGKGIRVRELSEMTGVDYSYISKLERGVSDPSIRTAEKMKQAKSTEFATMENSGCNLILTCKPK